MAVEIKDAQIDENILKGTAKDSNKSMLLYTSGWRPDADDKLEVDVWRHVQTGEVNYPCLTMRETLI